MARLKVHINKKDPSQEVINKYKYSSDFIDKQMKLHTFHGLRRLLFNFRKKEFYIVVLLMIIMLLWILGKI